MAYSVRPERSYSARIATSGVTPSVIALADLRELVARRRGHLARHAAQRLGDRQAGAHGADHQLDRVGHLQQQLARNSCCAGGHTARARSDRAGQRGERRSHRRDEHARDHAAEPGGEQRAGGGHPERHGGAGQRMLGNVEQGAQQVAPAAGRLGAPDHRALLHHHRRGRRRAEPLHAAVQALGAAVDLKHHQRRRRQLDQRQPHQSDAQGRRHAACPVPATRLCSACSQARSMPKYSSRSKNFGRIAPDW